MERSVWRGVPKFLLATTGLSVLFAFVKAVHGDWFGALLDLALAWVQLWALARLIHARVLEQDWQRQQKAWEEYARGQ